MERIGKYLIVSKLGQGGMGIVYKCRDTETQRLAAVKVLPQQLAADPAFLQRFKREVATLQRMNHPNIVRVYDRGVEGDAPYYAMEYVEGVSLEAVLAPKEKLDPLRAIRIARGVAEALQHSHALGIIHRDIKPANIMLGEGDTVKVMDFGIAKVLDATRMTATQSVIGTIEYMSPEQSQGGHVDARSDLFSLGVVLYQCVTARLPVTGATPSEFLMKLKAYPIEAPDAWTPELPRNLSALIMRLLEKDSTRRIESAQAVLRELDRVEQQIVAGITGRGPSVGEEPILTRAQEHRPLWKNPWVYVVLLLVIFTTYLLARPSRSASTEAAAPAESEKDVRPNFMILWARTETVRGRYDFAEDLCRLLIRHYPDTPQARAAEEQLKKIAEARAQSAADAAAPSPAPPEKAP